MDLNPQEIINPKPGVSPVFSREEVIEDYRIMYQSRQASLVGRREVLTGKAKFGIFGDGKELPQIAMAKVFEKGDFRSGYYRDQTFAFAKGLSSFKHFFAQLYAHPDVEADPFSAGRQMNSHYASRSLNADGSWRDLTQQYNSAADASPTGTQMPRLAGLAQASRLYRELPVLSEIAEGFSNGGNEIAFGTIGNASCAEGHFWEAINAVGVLQAPLIMSIWDDDYGISVPNEYQITKSNISEVLKGFQRDETGNGYEIFTVKGWDYVALCETYRKAAEITRKEHIPSIIHVIELTQPQGHSTSGSHERYKSKSRLAWEKEHDCLLTMRNWMIENGFAEEAEVEEWEKEDRKFVRRIKNEAWQAFQAPIKGIVQELMGLLNTIRTELPQITEIDKTMTMLHRESEPLRAHVMRASYRALFAARGEDTPGIQALIEWRSNIEGKWARLYDTHLYSESTESPMRVREVKPEYDENPQMVSGFELLNRCFDSILTRDPRVVAFGEDVGNLGDVNQGFAGLQEKHGRNRVMDTGIREATIMGQAIGLAQRGLRPIAEIQYLDYFIYGMQILSDDLATLHYRTFGGQKAPAIIRTRGHRLEGIWHAGSPLGMMIHALRGIHLLVPRNMTQAAGYYNTLLQGDDPAVMIEVLNGYRLKEKLPNNLEVFTLPLGVPEVLREGTDITVVTYGACCRIAIEAAKQLADTGIELEIIDVQSLLPFDIHHHIVKSLQKTNRIIFFDEDVPGGATGYMMQQVLETQKGYQYLDSEPKTVTAKAHRTAFGSDGDYFSKPQVEHLFRAAYELMNEVDSETYPIFY